MCWCSAGEVVDDAGAQGEVDASAGAHRFTPAAKPAAAFHHAIHRRALRQSATDDIISTRAQNL
jgi:hypothetical protein